VTAKDGGNADNVWNNYLPTAFDLFPRQAAKKKKNMYHRGTENTECNYSKAFTVITYVFKT
jgi:hypothetical protein